MDSTSTTIIDSERLKKELNRFNAFVRYKNHAITGAWSDYISFKDKGMFLETEEDYKTDAAIEAANKLYTYERDMTRLNYRKIYECVLEAMGSNNLVDYHQKEVFKSRFNPSSKDFNPAAEQVLYDLYYGNDDRNTFNRAVAVFGAKYDFLVYSLSKTLKNICL